MRMENIAQIDLNNNNLRDEGIKILSSAIKQLRSLVHLSVASNEITSKGCKNLCERGLIENENLVSLDIGSTNGLGRNRLTWIGGESISKLLAQDTNNI